MIATTGKASTGASVSVTPALGTMTTMTTPRKRNKFPVSTENNYPERTYTYTVTLGVSTRYVGSDDVDSFSLGDYGYSDQEWDKLSPERQEELISSWIEEYVWENIDSWGTVNKDA